MFALSSIDSCTSMKTYRYTLRCIHIFFSVYLSCHTISLCSSSLEFASLHTLRLLVFTILFYKTQSACGCFDVESDPFFFCDTGCLACLHMLSESVGLSLAAGSRLPLFVHAKRRRHISHVDTPLHQGFYCGAWGTANLQLLA